MAAADPKNCVKIEKEDISGDEIKCEDIADNELDAYNNIEENFKTIETKLSCRNCDYKANMTSCFVKHVVSEHCGSVFPCSICNSNFASEKLFTEHVNKTHWGKCVDVENKNFQAFFTCSLCDHKTVRSSLYVKHMFREHPGSSLQCSFCKLQFENGEQFLEHVKVAHKKNKRKVFKESGVFPCKECNKIFSKLSNLESHKRAVHNIQVSVCEFCCKEFKNKDYCRQHIRLVHESQFLDNVECDVCGKVFKSKANLYHHKRAVHEVEEDLICYICATKSRNSYMLRKHLKKCQVRAKMAPRTYVLGKNDQIQQQNGDKFFCKDCNKTFFTPKALRSHNRAAHTFDPLNCHICNREFKNVDYLKQHFRRGHYIQDSEQIIAMVKFVKPDYEPASSKKKDQDRNRAEVKLGEAWGFDIFQDNSKPAAVSSESLKNRQELVNKWREMEEMQRREKELENKILIEKQKHKEELVNRVLDEMNDTPVDNFKDIVSPSQEVLSQSNDWTVTSNQYINDNEGEFKFKTEDMLAECEVKIEAEDSECSSDIETKDVDSEPEEKEDQEEEVPPLPSDNKPFSCNECCKTYQNLKYLTSHIKTVHTVLPCSCPHCRTEFKNPRYLCQHLQRAHKLDIKSAKEYSLKASAKESDSIAKDAINITPKIEMKEEDNFQTDFTCSYCNKVFSSKSRLSHHVSNMHVVGEYLCPTCGEKFTLKQQLKNHNEKMHSKKAEGVCQFCSKTYKHLSSHIKDVHMKEECICPHCAKTFSNRKHLNGHLASVHSGEGQTRICPICSKQCKNPQYLRQHVRLVHETVEDVANYLSCDECGKQFANKAHLYHHTRAVHVVENCNCILCGRTYKNKIALGKHMKHAHDGMVKNPYSGGAEQTQVTESKTFQAAPPMDVDPPFQSRLEAYPRTFFGQSGWY